MQEFAAIKGYFLPSFTDELHVKACWFWNISLPQDTVASNSTVPSILKLDEFVESTAFTLVALKTQISIEHVSTNCLLEFRRGDVTFIFNDERYNARESVKFWLKSSSVIAFSENFSKNRLQLY